MIRWQEQYSPEERRVTRECLLIIAELPDGLLVQDDVLVIPEDASEELKDRMARLEPYLRWAAGKEANDWLPGAPANFPQTQKPDSPGPNAPGPHTRTPTSASENTSRTPDSLEGGQAPRTGAIRQTIGEKDLGHRDK